ncbi:hypothetical protein [Burkholderia phage FLC9]|nr:hypothetical protein [Burkholderia phage FLC9]
MGSEIAIFYHWLDPSTDMKLSRKTLHNNTPLYVCDDIFSWAAPHIKGMELYEIDVVYQKPLILQGQFTDYEEIFADHNRINQKFLEQGGFDIVIYTPHYLSRGVRQIALLKPKDQVLAIRRVPDHEIDWAMIERLRDEQNRGWSEIMFKDWKDAPMKNPYFHDKKVMVSGTTIYPRENLLKAVVKLGGTWWDDPETADLIIYGEDSDIHAARDPDQLYPDAMKCWEGKVDDLLQELPDGIESLF